MYQLLISNQQTSEMTYGFEESEATRQLELTTKKLKKNNFREK